MIRPSHLFTYDPPTSSRVQESVPTRPEDKFGVSVTCQASSTEVACHVETDVRRGCSDDPESPISLKDRGWGQSRCSGSRVVEHMGKTEYVDILVSTKQMFSNLKIATVDNTLSLLYNSAISRGLAHKLTRNLHALSYRRKGWLHTAYERHSAPWKPTGGPVHANTKKRRTDRNESGELAWNMVGEVVRMAEGRDQLMLGRVPPRQHKTYRNLK